MLFTTIDILFISCRRLRQHEINIPFYVSELLEFKPGSWWVYSTTPGSHRDSIYITSWAKRDRIENGPNYTSYNFVELKMMYNRRLGLGTQKSELYAKIVSPHIESDGPYATIETTLGTAPIMLYPFGRSAEKIGGSSRVDAVFPEITIGGNIYRNVTRFYCEYNYFHGGKCYLYYCPRVGLIRKEMLPTGQIWDLIKLNIVL